MEVSLRPGQEITLDHRTAGSFGCLRIQTESGPFSLNVIVTPERSPGAWEKHKHACHNAPGAFYRLVNGHRPQVIRYWYNRGRPTRLIEPSEISTGGTEPICPSCSDMPTFRDVSDINAIRAAGQFSLAQGGIVLLAALVVHLGVPTVLGFLYAVGRRLIPSRRGRRLRGAVHKAKAGDDFDTSTTAAFDDIPRHEFRRQQDAEDLKDATETVRRETERLKQREAEQTAKTQAKEEERAQALRDYEASIRRVKALQDRQARDQGLMERRVQAGQQAGKAREQWLAERKELTRLSVREKVKQDYERTMQRIIDAKRDSDG